MTTAIMRRSQFRFETDEPFEGLTDGTTWNGWAVPYVTEHTARAVLEQFGFAVRVEDGLLKYHALNDSFDECYIVDPTTIDGVVYYRLCDFCWDEC